MFTVKSFKACALLTSTCCHDFIAQDKTMDRTSLSEQERISEKFSQTKYTEFV